MGMFSLSFQECILSHEEETDKPHTAWDTKMSAAMFTDLVLQTH